jgi:hypothetical protein
MAPFTSHVYSVRPAKIFAHAKGDPFGQTRHTFGQTRHTFGQTRHTFG